MIDEVIIHIGMHKTGSSSIQASLHGFSTEGFHYADFGKANHSIPMSTIFMAKPHLRRQFIQRGYTLRRVQEIGQTYRDALVGQIENLEGKLIISGEDMSRFSVSTVTNMRDFFKERGIKVRVLAYVRAPHSFAVSSLQQMIVKAALKAADLPKPNYRQRFSPYLEVFGENVVEIRKFDPSSFIEKSVVQDFLLWCGMPDIELDERRVNERFSQDAVAILYYFNNYGPLSAGTDLAYLARKKMVSNILKIFDGKAFEIPIQNLILDRDIVDDLAWLREATGVEFDDEHSVEDRQPEEFSIEEFLRQDALQKRDEIRRHLSSVGVYTKPDASLEDLLTYWYYYFVSKIKLRKTSSVNKSNKVNMNKDNEGKEGLAGG